MSSGMMSGRSTCGRSWSSAAGGGDGRAGAASVSSLYIPLPSYCVRASPSTTVFVGFSSTSSCTSSPSALAASCATALKSTDPSNVSRSEGRDRAAAVGVTGAADVCSTANACGSIIAVVASLTSAET